MVCSDSRIVTTPNRRCGQTCWDGGAPRRRDSAGEPRRAAPSVLRRRVRRQCGRTRSLGGRAPQEKQPV